MQALAEAIRDHAREIIDRWDEENRKVQPYLRLRTRDDRLNHLVELITDLAFASLAESSTRDIQQKVLKSAARHGATRREQGFTPEDILKEFYLVRYALWAFIQERVPDANAAIEAISHIDRATSVTSRASLLGFHQRELEGKGLWPKVINDLLDLPALRGRE